MKINIDALISAISEANESIRRRETVLLERPLYSTVRYECFDDYLEDYEKWKKRCISLLNEGEKAEEKVHGMFQVLCMKEEEMKRALSAARAVEKWQEKTGWFNAPSNELIKRIGDWIFNEKSIEHYEMENDRFRWNKEVYAEFVDYWG